MSPQPTAITSGLFHFRSRHFHCTTLASFPGSWTLGARVSFRIRLKDSLLATTTASSSFTSGTLKLELWSVTTRHQSASEFRHWRSVCGLVDSPTDRKRRHKKWPTSTERSCCSSTRMGATLTKRNIFLKKSYCLPKLAQWYHFLSLTKDELTPLGIGKDDVFQRKIQ